MADTRTLSPEQRAASLKAAENAKSILYKLHGLQREDSLQYVAIGCQGSGNDHQRAVAKAVNDFIVRYKKRPDFILLLGDNIYEKGASTPDDPSFAACIDNIYNSEELKELTDIPIFLINGNHDANIRITSIGQVKGSAISINQEAHSYLPDEEYKTIDEKMALYSQENLLLKDLPLYNKPKDVFGLQGGNTALFCLNTNTLVTDFLHHLDHPEDENQITWLKAQFAAAIAGKKDITIALHHPPYTSGPRAFFDKFDTFHYLTQDQVNKLKELLRTKSSSYNDFVRLILAAICPPQPGKKIRFLAAHDHFMSYFVNEEFELVTSGAGGGSLHSQHCFADHPQVRCHIKEHGFTFVSAEGTEFHTVSGKFLKFNREGVLVREKNPDPEVEHFRELMLSICDQFLKELSVEDKIKKTEGNQANQDYYESSSRLFKMAINVTHAAKKFVFSENKDHEIIRDIENYLNQYHCLPSLQETIKEVFKLASAIPGNSVLSLLEEKLPAELKPTPSLALA